MDVQVRSCRSCRRGRACSRPRAECVQNLILPGLGGDGDRPSRRHDVVPLVRPLGARIAEVVACRCGADDREHEPRHGARRRSPSRPRRKSWPDEGGEEDDASGCRPAADHTHRFALERRDPSSLSRRPGVRARIDSAAVKIAVCVKQVPEAGAAKRIDPQTKRLDRSRRGRAQRRSTRTPSRRPCGSRRQRATARSCSSRVGPGAGARGAAQGARDGRRPRAARQRRRGRRLRPRRHELRARRRARARAARSRPLRPAGERLRRRRALGRRRRAPAPAARLAGGRARRWTTARCARSGRPSSATT